MQKSIVVAGILAAAGAGWFFLFRTPAATNAPNSIISNLNSMEAENKTTAAGQKNKSSSGDRPIPSASGPWPKAIAENVTFSFGRMLIKEDKSHTFMIRNEGEADLHLQAGTTTCKCTQFDFDPSPDISMKTAVVKPGEEIVLTMSWKAGEVPDRSFRHGGDVYTDDPNRPEIKYTVEGAIEMPFELLPQVWTVGNVYDNQPGRFKAAIATRIYEHFALKPIVSPSGKVKVTATPMTPAERARGQHAFGYSLDVEVASDIETGLFQEELELHPELLPEPINVTVTARKYGSIRLQQMAGMLFDMEKLQVNLGSFAASEGREAKMLLIVDEKAMQEPFQIKDVEADPSFLTAALAPLSEPTGTVHRYVMTLKVPPGRPHAQKVATKPGFIRISTNHPTGEVIHLHVLMYSN